MSTDSASDNVPSEESVRTMFTQAGITGEFQVRALTGGRNNCVFRVDTGSVPLLLKRYFHHPDDSRNRLATEFAWTRFASRHGIASVPRPLACNFSEHLGLYEFVDGARVAAGELLDGDLEQAICFLREINRLRSAADAQDLPIASEACFSLEQHLACVDRRLQRLHTSACESEIDNQMHHWLDGELIPAWRRIQFQASELTGTDELLRNDERCLSPSDFGFHNVLRERSGRLRFLDFEYAGWDDPAKLVCDFFNQVEVPVPFVNCGRMVAALTEELGTDGSLAQRVKHLLPIYRIKWCCIVLNDFLPGDSQRRAFASGAVVSNERKSEQLAHAERLLATLNSLGAAT